jgi:hypothetical protein
MTKKDQQTLWLVGGLVLAGGLIYMVTKKKTLSPAELAALQAQHAQAVQQGDFQTAAKLAADIASSPLGGAMAGGLTSLFSSSQGPGADQPPVDDAGA